MPALGWPRTRATGAQHQQDDETRDGADPFPFTLMHAEVSSISRVPDEGL